MRKGIAKHLTLAKIRRVYSVFFVALFVFLLCVSDFRHIKGYPVGLFLEIDPLVSITSFFTSWTVYKGLVLSLLVIVPTLVFGRFFCSWVCPLGILNQWAGRFLNRKKAVADLSANQYRPLYRIKYYLLTVLVVLALAGALQIGLFDPIALLTRSFATALLPGVDYLTSTLYLHHPVYTGGVAIALIFLAVIFANRFIDRLWCRVLCPLGACMGLMASVSLLRIRRNVDRCTDCRQCVRYCQGGCNPHEILRVSECHLCMNCLDQCPEDALHYGLSRPASSIQIPLDINRRRIVESAVLGVVLFPMMRSSLGSDNTAEAGVIRPPGSLAERDFLRRCIKCGQCMRVCPTNVLQPALLEGGFEALWTPILVNRTGYCEYNCVLCGRVCPTGAITPLTVEEKIGKGQNKAPVKVGTAFYDQGRCLPWSMHIECIVCEEVCPTSPKAIWFKTTELHTRQGNTIRLKQPVIDASLCIGCGICENKCPVHDKPAVRVTSIGETRSKTNQMILRKKD